MVVACLALGIALTGTSVAAVTALAPNSVGTPQIKANAVTAAKLRNANVTGAKIARNAVTGTKVLNGSLTAADFVASSLPKGPAGPTGATGPAGPAGPAGTIGPVTVRQAGVVVPGGVAQNGADDTETVTVNCNAGEKAISAGTGWSDDAAKSALVSERFRTLAPVTAFALI